MTFISHHTRTRKTSGRARNQKFAWGDPGRVGRRTRRESVGEPLGSGENGHVGHLRRQSRSTLMAGPGQSFHRAAESLESSQSSRASGRPAAIGPSVARRTLLTFWFSLISRFFIHPLSSCGSRIVGYGRASLSGRPRKKIIIIWLEAQKSNSFVSKWHLFI